MTRRDGNIDTNYRTEHAVTDHRMARFAQAVTATSPPLRHAATGDLTTAALTLADGGIPPDRVDWWYTIGHACAGLVIDELQCDRSAAEWATAAVMYARLAAGEALDDTDLVVEEAKLAVAWDAGRRGAPTVRPLGDTP